MKYTTVLAIMMFILCGNALATPQDAVPRLSADRFIEYYSGEAGVPELEQKPDRIIKMEFARGYLAGVVDGAQGKTWCDKGKVKTAEIDSYVIGELRELPRHERRKGAANLIVELLKQKFPCR